MSESTKVARVMTDRNVPWVITEIEGLRAENQALRAQRDTFREAVGRCDQTIAALTSHLVDAHAENKALRDAGNQVAARLAPTHPKVVAWREVAGGQ